MLGQQEPVIGGKNERGIAPQIMAIEVIEEPTEVVIASGDERRVVRANFGNLFGAAVDALLVDRPIENAAGPAGRVLLLEPLRRLERLVRIEAFEHQKP